MNFQFVSDYNMDTIKRDTMAIDGSRLHKRYEAIKRLRRIKNSRVIRTIG